MSVSKPITEPDMGVVRPTKRFAGVSVMEVVKSFAKKISTVVIVYMLGYFDFSAAWLVAPVIFSVIRDEWRKEKELKRNIAKAAAMCNERDVILARVEDLPSWVFFPDVERAEWVNKILRQVWPNVNHYAKALIKDTIEPAIAESLAGYKMSGFQFQKMILGSIPPRVHGVKVYDKNVARNEILMDLDIFYAGDCDISFTLAGISGGIKDFQIHGMVRVVMKPLITVIPMIGGLQIFFLNNPNIDFNLVGVADVLDMPGLSDLLRRIIVEQVANIMVLPNKLPITLSDSINPPDIKAPEPEGVLRIHVVEAKKLMKKDIGMLGKGKSDPYAIVNVGAQTFRTSTIDNTVDPKWDFWCEFVIHSEDQLFTIIVKDHDDLSKKDSKLGRAEVDVSTVVKKGEVDTWITLKEAKHGMVHLRMSWLSLTSDPHHLKAALAETQQLRVTSMSSALLTVFVDSIKNLPNARPQSKPDPFVTISLGKQIEKTITQWRTDCPVYETGLVFLVHNPENDTILFKVTDNKTMKDIGELQYKLSQLMEKPNMVIDSQPFQLRQSGGECKIILSLKLTILKYNKSQSKDDLEDVPILPRQSSMPEKISPPATPLRKQGSVSEVLDSTKKAEGNSETMIRKEMETTLEAAPIKRVGSIHSVSSGTGEHGLGRILLEFKYQEKRQRLEIVIRRIAKLPQPDPNNIPDPYVKMYLLPERNRDSKRRTESVKDDCNPVYDHAVDYIISLAELSTRQLEVSVCTRKGMFSSQPSCLGQVLVNLGEMDVVNGVTEWFDLMPEFHKDKDD